MSDRRLEHLFERFRRQGDVDALGQVFDATAPSLRRVARHLTRDAAEAEDLAQATFLAAIEKRASFDVARELSPWLTGILLRQASLERRARARAVEPDRLESRNVEDPADTVAARELSEALTVALSRLRPVDREVLIPLLLDGRRAAEIARELGSRPDTVHMRIHRGLQRLRRLLPAGFALGALARFAGARGLGAVRAEVLKSARLQLAPSGSVAVGLTAVGVLMSLKKVAVALVVVVALVLGARVVTSYADGRVADATVAGLDVGSRSSAESVQAPRDERARSSAAEIATVEAATAPVAQLLELALVRYDGSVVAGAPVALVDASGVVHAARTDASGACSFAAGSGAGDLYVRDDGAFPEHFAVELAAGRRAIALAKGSELAGRLTLIGDGNIACIDLELTTDSAPVGLARATDEVFRALGLFDSWSLLVARTTTDSDSRFRFRLPDATWSGLLRLPRELVFAEAVGTASAHERVVPGPCGDLEARIAYRRRVSARLVDVDGVALADALVDCILKWSQGSGTHTRTSVRSRSDGRFAVALWDEVEIAELEVREVRTADGRVAHASRSARWDAPSDLLDAGDIVCTFPPSRPLDVRVADPDGAPIAGARVAVGTLDVVTTDKLGVARFGAVPYAETGLRVTAPGWAIATVAMSAESESPLAVVLAPTNRLTIALPQAVGGRWDLRIDLICRSNLPETSLVDGTQLRVVHGRASYSPHESAPGQLQASYGFADDGSIELEELLVGVPIRIELVARPARTGTREVWSSTTIDALGTAEHRRLDLVIDDDRARSMHVLRVHVVDEQSRPLDLAGLGTEIGTGGSSTLTDRTGSAHLDLLGIDETDVEVSKRGYQPFRVRAWDLTSDRVLEATLVRGRDLRVELVDARGRPIDGARLQADVAQFGAPSSTFEEGPGVYLLRDVPEAPTRITVDLAGAHYEHLHPGPGELVRIVVPEHGRLHVACGAMALRDAAKLVRLALIPTGTSGAAQSVRVERAGELAIDTVLPGDYTVGLESAPPAAEGADPVYAPIGELRRVTVVAGQTARVEL